MVVSGEIISRIMVFPAVTGSAWNRNGQLSGQATLTNN